jgi:hypothetical protein
MEEVMQGTTLNPGEEDMTRASSDRGTVPRSD